MGPFWVQGLRRLKPEAIAIVEEEVEASQAEYVPRFMGMAEFVWELFEAHDALVEGRRKKLIHAFERHYFGAMVCSALACEGEERRMRPHTAKGWRERLLPLGLAAVPLSAELLVKESEMLQRYAKGFTVMEEEGLCARLCWQGTPLIHASELSPVGNGDA